MKLIAVLLTVLLLQDIPYKAKEDFEIKLDYQFKQRPAAEVTSIHFDETAKERDRRTSSSMLPFLIIHVNLLKVPAEEVKVRVTNNANGAVYLTRKIKAAATIPIEFGFTDDVKDRVTPYEYKLTFISADKKEVSRIKILIEEDGTFLVNDEKRGKF